MHKANAKEMRVLHDFCFQLQVVKQHNTCKFWYLEFFSFATEKKFKVISILATRMQHNEWHIVSSLNKYVWHEQTSEYKNILLSVQSTLKAEQLQLTTVS